jgi:hypothetical protein
MKNLPDFRVSAQASVDKSAGAFRISISVELVRAAGRKAKRILVEERPAAIAASTQQLLEWGARPAWPALPPSAMARGRGVA